MAGKGRAASQIVRWGVKYGPAAVIAAKNAKEPAKAAAQKALSGVQAKRRAVEHARAVVDGSLLKAFDPAGDPVWVVFSGDDAIAMHPPTVTPLEVLLRHADLGQRQPPESVPLPGDTVRRITSRQKGNQSS